MTILTWLTGPNGQLISSACVIIILLLMLFMSTRLYASYRNKRIYRLLTLTIPLFMVQNTVLAMLAYPEQKLPPWLHIVSMILQIVSFIIINFVFMKLYTHRGAQIKVMPFVLLIALTFVIAAVQSVFMDPSDDILPGGQYRLLGLDFYSLIVTFMILLGTKGTEMNGKFSASLITYFILDLSRIADGYVFHGSVNWLVLLSYFLPIVYFMQLFLLLFEWVIERLMMTYQSSITDGLTGLYNRRHFTSKAEQILRRQKGLAVIFCDIDNFKKLNDTQGHHKADVVLKQVAEIMKEESAGIGAAGRYGGEELLACISTDRVKPDRVAESIRSRVEKETIVTVSVGVSTSKDGMEVAQLIKLADEAMYHSKTTGKNKVTLFNAMPASKKKALST
ncbi:MULTISPECIES: GGDEF domain-containing protein [unclassified Paenibacillus]|uniref:GGDEF domain-containing protein n=1 Tax=unclassified Paenibacillus TaxID=185978 RepID=UPI0010533AFA|nr:MULTISPECIES: GGDEF domain-containing protein [unclassified Paenibacillus]NIK68318.1 diguanylate cyclase (GGDEF)-like protein [Paenibacillus sp. BK720]TCM99468.1 diguanylate cyclase (GGDEF)-like protein [Paenibacillus sp. BK033]